VSLNSRLESNTEEEEVQGFWCGVRVPAVSSAAKTAGCDADLLLRVWGALVYCYRGTPLRCRVQDSGFRVQGSGSGCRVRVQGQGRPGVAGVGSIGTLLHYCCTGQGSGSGFRVGVQGQGSGTGFMGLRVQRLAFRGVGFGVYGVDHATRERGAPSPEKSRKSQDTSAPPFSCQGFVVEGSGCRVQG